MASGMLHFDYDKSALIARLNLTDLSETDQDRVLERVDQLLNQRVATIAESMLSDGDLAEFNKLSNPIEAHAFLAQKMPLDTVFQHELDHIIAELSAGLDSI